MLAAPVLLCLCVSLMNRSYFSPWFLQVELQWKRRRENIREPDRECLTHNETRDGEGRWGVSRPEFPYKFNWGFRIILSVSTADVCVWPENKHVFLSSCACINMQGWPANVTGEENVAANAETNYKAEGLGLLVYVLSAEKQKGGFTTRPLQNWRP